MHYIHCSIPLTAIFSVLRIFVVDGDILVGFRFRIPARSVLTIVLLQHSRIAIGKACITAKLYFFRLFTSVTETVATGVHQSKFGHAGKATSIPIFSCVVIVTHDDKSKRTLPDLAAQIMIGVGA